MQSKNVYMLLWILASREQYWYSVAFGNHLFAFQSFIS